MITFDDILAHPDLKTYTPALLPGRIKRGPVGMCFDICALTCMRQREFTYVEGLATDPSDPDNVILHAWVTDGVHAFDPTWDAIDDDGLHHPVPSLYQGIEMDIMLVAKFMKTTGYQCVIANHHRAPELADKCLNIRRDHAETKVVS